MADRNLFTLGRRTKDEDQLTEMLAYVWERRPDLAAGWLRGLGLPVATDGPWEVATQVTAPGAGRFDLTLEVREEAFVVVESKLGAELTSQQLRRYVDEVAARTEPLRAVISLTQTPPPRDEKLLDHARSGGVALVQARWQGLAEATADPSQDGIEAEFVTMLMQEGLVVPQALSSDDWTAWNRGASVLARVKLLLEEARSSVTRISPGLRASSRWGANERWIYSGYKSDHLELGIGFSANESPRRLASPPIVWVYLTCTDVSADERSCRAVQVCRKVPGAHELWSGYPYLKRPAQDVLGAGDFLEQVRRVTRLAYEVAVTFRDAGFLSADLTLLDPDHTE